MSDEQLKLVASSTINGLFSSGKVSAPISSMDLLSRVVSSASLLPTSPRFRLTDLSKFEAILDGLSQNWDHGTISLARDDRGLTVMDVHLGNPGSVNALAGLTTRKRKRVVDEDADSAAGNDDEQDSFEGPISGSTTLTNLSKELKEVYIILQKSTAKGRLLAEQVCISMSYRPDYSPVAHSTNRLTTALSPFAPRLLRTNAQSTVAPPLHLLVHPPPLCQYSVIASISGRSSVYTLIPPSAIAPTSTLATLSRLTPNRHLFHPFHLITLVRVLLAYLVGLGQEEEARRRRHADICIMRSIGTRRILMPVARWEKNGTSC